MKFIKELGATRVVTAREMSFAEIKDIADHVDVYKRQVVDMPDVPDLQPLS